MKRIGTLKSLEEAQKFLDKDSGLLKFYVQKFIQAKKADLLTYDQLMDSSPTNRDQRIYVLETARSKAKKYQQWNGIFMCAKSKDFHSETWYDLYNQKPKEKSLWSLLKKESKTQTQKILTWDGQVPFQESLYDWQQMFEKTDDPRQKVFAWETMYNEHNNFIWLFENAVTDNQEERAWEIVKKSMYETFDHEGLQNLVDKMYVDLEIDVKYESNESAKQRNMKYLIEVWNILVRLGPIYLFDYKDAPNKELQSKLLGRWKSSKNFRCIKSAFKVEDKGPEKLDIWKHARHETKCFEDILWLIDNALTTEHKEEAIGMAKKSIQNNLTKLHSKVSSETDKTVIESMLEESKGLQET